MNLTSFPKQPLGFFPTPLTELTRLSKEFGGPRIYMKRDDQSGLAFGGNKVRKLEYIFSDALAKGCDTIITAGAAQSNHCRQTAAAASKLGLECHLVLGGKEPGQVEGNLLLDKIFGAQIHWSGKHRKGEDIPDIFTRLEEAGKTPCVIPYGGSNELGVLGFVAAAEELNHQRKGPEFTHIVFASSSGGTQAGLMLGKQMLQKDWLLVGINIDKEEPGDKPFAQQIISLANQTAAMLDLKHEFTAAELILNSEYLGDGYGVVGEAEREAMSLTARTEGILLDPVYTGRAMAGLFGMIRSGEINRNDHVLFWHTGGAPALFACSDEIGV